MRIALVLLTLLATACRGDGAKSPNASPTHAAPSALHVFAEGPCPKLSIEAAGERRFLVYGDHGRMLAGWVPGERLATAETIAELRGSEVFRRPSLLRGLPTDARGYVHGELALGGTLADPWLVRTTVRYSLVKRGPLFEREPVGYRFDAGWRQSDEPVTIPLASRELPDLPISEMCGEELGFVPLTWTATPEGGLVVAGRCDDEKPANYPVTTLLVAHGAPGAKSWRVMLVPAGEKLTGIVNLSLSAASEREIYLAAYEPFKEPEERIAFLSRFDGEKWNEIELAIKDGIMDLATDGRGTLWLAAGRALYKLSRGEAKRVALPPLRFSPERSRVHVHAVRYLDGELWAEGSYEVHVPGERGVVWASALFSSRAPKTPLYCDAREPAENALYEAEP